MSTTIIIYIVALAITLVNCAYTERKALKGRRCLSKAELKREFKFNDDAGYEALKQISVIFRIKPGYLRPMDKLGEGGMLDDYNSWGTDYLNDYLAENGVTKIEGEWLLSDFVSWYRSHFRKHERSFT